MTLNAPSWSMPRFEKINKIVITQRKGIPWLIINDYRKGGFPPTIVEAWLYDQWQTEKSKVAMLETKVKMLEKMT